METIKAHKTRNGGYGFSDSSNEHDFVIFDEGQHAIDEDGLIWQVVDGIDEDENVAYITFEDGGHIFNYAEDGGAISWMKDHYCALLSLVDWNKVEEELEDEDVFDLMRDSKSEDAFCQSLTTKYKENTWEDKSYDKKVNDVIAMNQTFRFVTDYEDASSAASAVKTGYDADPTWFGYKVNDTDKFEVELEKIIKDLYFDTDEDEKRIEFDEDKLRVYAYGYGCQGSPYNGDPEVEMDMQEYLDEEYNGKYEVNERPSYFEEEDCWSAAVWEHDEDIES